MKAKFRSLRFRLEEVLGAEIPNDHPVLVWLVQFGCLCINVGRRYADGKTAYELRCGRSWKRNLGNFVERVMWLPTGKRPGVNAADWCMEGVFLGIAIGANSDTDDFIIGTPNGVETGRAIRRYPEVNRWRIADVLAAKGTPWCREPLVGSGKEPLFHGRLPARAELPPIISRSAQRGDPAAEAFTGMKGKSVYMRREYFDRFGMTTGCRGCLALLQSERATNHKDSCRARIEGELAKCGDNDQTRYEQSEAKTQNKYAATSSRS